MPEANGLWPSIQSQSAFKDRKSVYSLVDVFAIAYRGGLGACYITLHPRIDTSHFSGNHPARSAIGSVVRSSASPSSATALAGFGSFCLPTTAG